jgi:predicted site-specific integrase-resolvase
MSDISEILLLRRREVAAMLAVSQAQVFKWERAGLLKSVRLPGLRAVRYEKQVVMEFAKYLVTGRMSSTPSRDGE